MIALNITTGHYVMVLTKWSLSTECVVQHDSPEITNDIPHAASERDANEQISCYDNTPNIQ